MITINSDRKEIDIDELKDELIRVKKQLFKNNSFSMYIRDYEDYSRLNSLLHSISGLHMQGNGIKCVTKKYLERIDKYNYKALNDYYEAIQYNRDLIETIFENYRAFLQYIGLINLSHPKNTRVYSEKEMFDIVVDYYSTFGKDYVDTVNKIIHDSKYESSVSDEEGYSGASYFSKRSNKSYITVNNKRYNTYNLITTVHELGHVYEYDKFINPQVKKISLYRQYGMELSSCFFEMEFLEYLRKNHIDIETSDAVFIDRLLSLYEFGYVFDKVFRVKNGYIEMNGNLTNLDEKDPNKKTIELKDALLYGIGFYTGIHMAELYERDPKDFMKRFNQMIATREETSMEEKIEFLGIEPNTFCSNEIIRERILRVSNDTRRRFNINL